MFKLKLHPVSVTSMVVASLYLLTPVGLHAQQSASPAVSAAPTVHVGPSDVGGMVASPNGPEAGVWVIAETNELPTRFIKIVVTDDQGRYLIPDLPQAHYNVWVRGYGLVDSPKVQAAPGNTVDVKAVLAPSAAAAAEYYPALYWYAMLQIPATSDFPGTGNQPNGNGIDPRVKSQQQWLDTVKTDGCITCHQLGDKATRTLSPKLGQFPSSYDAWLRRIQSGQASRNMINNAALVGPQKLFQLFADWTDRIAAGELPKSQPQRPQGLERNIVVTMWDWSRDTGYMHDVASTDRRNPTVNAYGPVYGSTEESTDYVPVLDPVQNSVSEIKLPVSDPKTPSTKDNPIYAPSIYWGDKPIWDAQANPHSLMLDEKGRVWFTAASRPPDDPAYCKQGSDLVSAQEFPQKSSPRQVTMYDPATKKFTMVGELCFSTQHLQFAPDADDTLWFSTGNAALDTVGWLDVKKFEETGDAVKSQGWTPFILDTKGDGKRGDYVEPNQPVDPTKDKRIIAGGYGIAPDPHDGTVWSSVRSYPGGLTRVIPGNDPPTTTLTEYFETPWNDPKSPGYSPRGMDIASDGVVWAPLASGQLASFDRRKCKGPLNGPKATGQQCPEGWTLYAFPGPQFEGINAPGSAEASYYVWVDQFNVTGLGKDLPIATGNESESLMILKDGQWITMRVPYPLGFYSKGLDGRIDDPNGGWKGRGLWTSYSQRTPTHIEGGDQDPRSKVVHFQIRPDPLAD